MADALDDFFARKDRVKKTKGKKPGPVTDEVSVVANVPTDDAAKDSRRKEKDKPAVQPIPSTEVRHLFLCSFFT